MREAASRGFWVSTYAPYGYRKAYVQNGAKKRPRLVLNPPADAVVRRMFQMAASGISLLDITRTLNDEGIATPNGKHWLKTSIHRLLANEAYTGTVVWGTNAKDGAPPVRVENAFPGIVTQEEFERVAQVLHAKAPSQVHPRRATSPYLLSGLAKCQHFRKSLSAQEAKGGKYTYYVCQSLLKRGRGACDTPRLNAARFERLIIDQIREHILTESNIRDLVRLVDEEMDGVAREERQKLEAIEGELAEVRRRMDRLWFAVETSDMEVNDILPRIRQHQKRQERLERTASEARTALAQRQVLLDRVDVITAYVREMRDFLRTSNTTESRGVHPVLREGDRGQARHGDDPLHHPDTDRRPHSRKGCRGDQPARGRSQHSSGWHSSPSWTRFELCAWHPSPNSSAYWGRFTRWTTLPKERQIQAEWG